MTERLYILEDVDPVVFYGLNKSNLVLLGNLFPKLKIMSHKNVIKILGESNETEKLLSLLEKIEKHCATYNQLTEEDIVNIAHGNQTETDAILKANGNLILYGVGGKPITARGDNQKKLVKSFNSNDLNFAIGPAGSGKTFIAIALAVKSLKAKAVRRIILSRPAVEAGEKLGFLPGEMKDKLDPYLQPLYDALGEMIPAPKLKEYLETGVIQIAPLAFMRGRTLNDAVIILDEAQNTTTHQMKMFLTRLGIGGKMIVTGDITQIDLPRGVRSGLKEALSILEPTEGIGVIRFEKQDIVRHPLVQKIVDAYDNKKTTFIEDESSSERY
ncbi:PhoH family protein [Porphyromonas pogonae]|uniref:PhoH family protein n=1 Tax=Porphyromonas pogonae TaxID=867595 RepID=UPI002E79D19D|nr:PhoH family protein [Porphyromonas pogonae]